MQIEQKFTYQNIKTKAIPNKKMVSLHISAYKNIINVKFYLGFKRLNLKIKIIDSRARKNIKNKLIIKCK